MILVRVLNDLGYDWFKYSGYGAVKGIYGSGR